MGCTSSAPNTPNVMANSVSEKNLDESEDNDMKQIDEGDEATSLDNANGNENATNATNVLPTCDNLDETIQLARNNQSFIKTATTGLGGANENGNEEKADEDDKTKAAETTEIMDLDAEEKLERLEEVVEKVVELFAADHQDTAKQPIEPPTNNDKIEQNTEENIATVTDESDKIEELQEMVSPSQSESSRATRWEALADIAAELPPSLAVDPVTGQIYALSK